MMPIASILRRCHARLLAASHGQALLLGVALAGAAITLYLDLLVDNAVVFHDEYIYKTSADVLLDQDALLQRGWVDYLPNRLYFWLYGFASPARQNFYVLAQCLNVLFWMGGALLVCQLGRALGVRRSSLPALCLLVMLLPLSTYTKYFMPESMFFFLFAAGAVCLLRGLAQATAHLLALSGALAGLAYFVKPHAVLFAGATTVFLLLAQARLPARWRAPLYYAAAFCVVATLGTLFVNQPRHLASPALYDRVIQDMLGTAAGLLRHPGPGARALASVALGHAALLLAFWPIVVASAGTSLRAIAGRAPLPAADGQAAARQWFGLWLLCVLAGLLAVVLAYTVLMGETGRVHTRYYAFLYRSCCSRCWCTGRRSSRGQCASRSPC